MKRLLGLGLALAAASALSCHARFSPPGGAPRYHLPTAYRELVELDEHLPVEFRASAIDCAEVCGITARICQLAARICEVPPYKNDPDRSEYECEDGTRRCERAKKRALERCACDKE